jgi:hypothetical protein
VAKGPSPAEASPDLLGEGTSRRLLPETGSRGNKIWAYGGLVYEEYNPDKEVSWRIMRQEGSDGELVSEIPLSVEIYDTERNYHRWPPGLPVLDVGPFYFASNDGAYQAWIRASLEKYREWKAVALENQAETSWKPVPKYEQSKEPEWQIARRTPIELFFTADKTHTRSGRLETALFSAKKSEIDLKMDIDYLAREEADGEAAQLWLKLLESFDHFIELKRKSVERNKQREALFQ